MTVTLSDGRGGSATGSLVIHVGLPSVPNAPPVIDQSFQSVESVAVGGTVLLRVTAHDPEGAAVSFTWSATGGTLGGLVTSSSRSEVAWTAPAHGGSFTVTAVVQDAGGAQATQLFAIAVIGPPGGGAVRVAAGAFHTLALKPDGALWATGDNRNGQLGDGTTTERQHFIQVPVPQATRLLQCCERGG